MHKKIFFQENFLNDVFVLTKIENLSFSRGFHDITQFANTLLNRLIFDSLLFAVLLWMIMQECQANSEYNMDIILCRQYQLQVLLMIL